MRHDINLLLQITKAHVKLQNESSVLGIAWYLLGPLLLFGIMLFIFSHRLGANIAHYPLYLLMGIITWNFFATGTGRAMHAITGNAALIKSIPIRTEILVLSAVLHALVSHVFEIMLFMGMLLYFGITPSYLLLYIFVLIILLLFTYGMGLFLASVFVFFRDVQQIWSVLTRAWWFATPVFYIATTTGLGSKLNLFNPLYYGIHLSRELLIYQRVPPLHLFGNFIGFAMLMLCIGYYFLHTLRPHFIARL